MKAVILAGGFGTRISEETHLKPKPMVEIGGKPILWHIMKVYSAHGVNDFVIACGYKGYLIKEYFANYFLHMSDVTIDLVSNTTMVHERYAEPWKVTLVDTGDETMTGGRLKRLAGHLKDEEAFCFTYGDGLADVDIKSLIAFHHEHGKPATITAVQPPGRYGALDIAGAQVSGFLEKPGGDGGLINGGFFVLSPDCLSLIEDDSSSWEGYPLTELARRGDLMAFAHHGFWQPMDTLRDKTMLEALWNSGKAPLEDLVSARSKFWRERRVFLTGHTGFKGGWLALWLNELGSLVHGYALDPPTVPSLYESAGVSNAVAAETIADLSEREELTAALERAQPEIVFISPRNPLVRIAYAEPIRTLAVNVMGTAAVLEAARTIPSVRAIIVVTTDKVYENIGASHAFRESDPLGAGDPYSTSKAAAELVVAGYRESWFASGARPVNVATARAGNVVGGGDWAAERLVPDCIRAFSSGQAVTLRRPDAIRPWQHVLEPLSGYLRLGEQLLSPEGARFTRAWNFGPDQRGDSSVASVAKTLATMWGDSAEIKFDAGADDLHEAHILQLDSSAAREQLGWRSRWSLNDALQRTVTWHKSELVGKDMAEVTRAEIREYEAAGS